MTNTPTPRRCVCDREPWTGWLTGKWLDRDRRRLVFRIERGHIWHELAIDIYAVNVSGSEIERKAWAELFRLMERDDPPDRREVASGDARRLAEITTRLNADPMTAELLAHVEGLR